jgi:hypothetical protein
MNDIEKKIGKFYWFGFLALVDPLPYFIC